MLSLGTDGSLQISNHQYNRLRFPKKRKNKSQAKQRSGSESSAYYITPEHDGDDGVEYYVDFDEEHLEQPYVDASESLLYTDSHYSTESDLHLQQQRNQKHFVTSSSLELPSENEDIHVQAAEMMNDTTRQQPHKYRLPKSKNKTGVKSSSGNSKDRVDELREKSTPTYQEIIATTELVTEYTSAKTLEDSTVI